MARGKAVINLLNLDPGERVATVLPVRDLNESGRFVIMVTRNGQIKRTALSAFSHPKKIGIIALTINPEDELVSASLTDGKNIVFIATRNGKSISFHENDIRVMGRSAAGVRGIRLSSDDAVVSMDILTEGSPEKILTVKTNGYGKRTPASDYRLQSRGGMGLITIKIEEENVHLVNAFKVDDEDQLMMITDTGRIIRIRVKEIMVYHRNTQGVKLFEVAPGERVVGVARLEEEKEDPES